MQNISTDVRGAEGALYQRSGLRDTSIEQRNLKQSVFKEFTTSESTPICAQGSKARGL